MNTKNFILILLILIALIAGVWYGLRPYLIRQKCHKESYEEAFREAIKTDLEKSNVQDRLYQECLEKNGL